LVINIYNKGCNFFPPKNVVFYITPLFVAFFGIPTFSVRFSHPLGLTVNGIGKEMIVAKAKENGYSKGKRIAKTSIA